MEHFNALVYLIGTFVGILATVCLTALIYHITRKKLEHPTLGLLILSGRTWGGLKPHFLSGEPAVRIQLPGDRTGPDEESVERFGSLWSKVQAVIDEIRPSARAEYEEIKDNCEEKELLVLVSEIAEKVESSAKEFDRYWVLSEVGLKEEEDGEGWYWYLEFEVAWDVEHSRTACLDLDFQLLNYDLSCAI